MSSLDEVMPGFGAEAVKLMRELMLKEDSGEGHSEEVSHHERDDMLQYMHHEPVDNDFHAQKMQAELANIEEKHQLKLVLEHFKRESDVLKTEALNTEKSLSMGMTDEDRARIGLNLELKLSELAKSANPYNRMLAASMGACPEILSNDPVSYVRLETLKNTGHYSENYRARENSYVVIKEYIRQNIHVDYFASINEQISSLVELQKSANKIIYAIEKGDKDSYYAFLDKVSTHPELKDSFQEAQMHMDILMQSFDAPFDKKTQEELKKDSQKAENAKYVLSEIKIGDETPLGVVIAINIDSIKTEEYISSEACDSNLILDNHPSEFYDYVLSKQPVEKNLER